MSDQIAELRAAAKRLRATDSGSLMRRDLEVALADLLDLEAATRSEMGPFAELVSMAIEVKSGVKGYITIAQDDDGNPKMYADTIEPCLAVARVINGVADARAALTEGGA